MIYEFFVVLTWPSRDSDQSGLSLWVDYFCVRRPQCRGPSKWWNHFVPIILNHDQLVNFSWWMAPLRLLFKKIMATSLQHILGYSILQCSTTSLFFIGQIKKHIFTRNFQIQLSILLFSYRPSVKLLLNSICSVMVEKAFL